VTEQLDTPKIITILNIPFILVQRDNYAGPPLFGHLSDPKNNIEKLR